MAGGYLTKYEITNKSVSHISVHMDVKNLKRYVPPTHLAKRGEFLLQYDFYFRVYCLSFKCHLTSLLCDRHVYCAHQSGHFLPYRTRLEIVKFGSPRFFPNTCDQHLPYHLNETSYNSCICGDFFACLKKRRLHFTLKLLSQLHNT